MLFYSAASCSPAIGRVGVCPATRLVRLGAFPAEEDTVDITIGVDFVVY